MTPSDDENGLRVCMGVFALYFLAFFVATCASGCSALLPSDVDVRFIEGKDWTASLEFDGVEHLDNEDRAWWGEWARRHFLIWDVVLQERGMPPLLPTVDGLHIKIMDKPDGSRISGQYNYGQNLMELWLASDVHRWQASALAHETMHLYDDRVLLDSQTDWISHMDQRHFLLGDLGSHLHVEVEERTLETAWRCWDAGPEPPPGEDCVPLGNRDLPPF